jgi:hypothetical protein
MGLDKKRLEARLMRPSTEACSRAPVRDVVAVLSVCVYGYGYVVRRAGWREKGRRERVRARGILCTARAGEDPSEHRHGWRQAGVWLAKPEPLWSVVSWGGREGGGREGGRGRARGGVGGAVVRGERLRILRRMRRAAEDAGEKRESCFKSCRGRRPQIRMVQIQNTCARGGAGACGQGPLITACFSLH